MSKNYTQVNIWMEIGLKIIPGLILGFVLAYANNQFWHKQEEYKKLTERIDHRIDLYATLSYDLFQFMDYHNAVSPYYRLRSCNTRCLQEKEPLENSKRTSASNISRLLFKVEVYFPDSMEQIKNIKKSVFRSYKAPSITITSKHDIYLVFRKALAHLGDVVKNDIGIL